MNKNIKTYANSIKGITLIALVITIIVLLILAGISINILLGDNSVVSKAQTAKEKTLVSETKEQVQMAVMNAASMEMGKLNETSLRSELKKSFSEITDNDITGNEKDGWIVTVKGKGYSISKDGEVNETFWKEVKDENGDASEIHSIDGTVSELKIGDIINYIPTKGLDITNDEQMQIKTNADINGAEDQIIDLRDYTGKWRVLGIENGKINLISEKIAGMPKRDTDSDSNHTFASVYVRLKGQAGYINAENELNRICSLYGKGKYAESARSITVEDINKITGYDPEHTGVNVNKATEAEIAAGTKYGAGTIHEYGNKIIYEWDGTTRPKYTYNTTSDKLTNSHIKGFLWYDGKAFHKLEYTTTPGKICELTSNEYYYHPETLTKEDDATKSVGIARDSIMNKMLFNIENFGIGGEYEYYWLASKYILPDIYAVKYGVRVVRNNMVIGNWNCTYSHTSEDTDALGLRPVVTLKSNVKLKKAETQESNDGVNTWDIYE